MHNISPERPSYFNETVVCHPIFDMLHFLLGSNIEIYKGCYLSYAIACIRKYKEGQTTWSAYSVICFAYFLLFTHVYMYLKELPNRKGGFKN